MRKYNNLIIYIFWCAVVFAAFILCASAITTKDGNTESPNSNRPISGYTVKEYHGKIAVFKASETTPLQILPDIYVRDLPTFDRELLKNGIYVESETKLNELLEDYDN